MAAAQPGSVERNLAEIRLREDQRPLQHDKADALEAKRVNFSKLHREVVSDQKAEDVQRNSNREKPGEVELSRHEEVERILGDLGVRQDFRRGLHQKCSLH
jgi:hypothetical protein